MIGSVLAAMADYFGTDVKRINHALKVFGYAEAICVGENIGGGELERIGYAAILHDIGIHEAERKHHSTVGEFQELEGPPIARRMLQSEGLPNEMIDRICHLVGHHHSYGKVDGRDLRILMEADFLVNAFEDRLDAGAIRAAGLRIFETASGLRLLRSMYGI